MIILIVEDHPMSQLVIQGILEHAGHRVVVAEDGATAIDKWRQYRPDVVMMDMQLPVMDGLEATRRIRQAEQSGDVVRTRIIAITANDSVADRQACLDAGMDDFLAKPLTMELIARVLAGGG